MNKPKQIIEKIKDVNDLTEKSLKTLVSISRKNLRELRKKLPGKAKKPTAHFLAYFLLERNLTTYKITRHLVDKKQIDESIVLMRLMLERAALVFKSLKDNLDTREIEKLKGSKCITEIKKHIVDVGKFYGEFSKVAHSDPYLSIMFLFGSKENIKPKSTDDIRVLFNIILSLVIEVNLAVTRFLHQKYIKATSYWKLDNKRIWNYRPPHKGKFTSLLLFSMLFQIWKQEERMKARGNTGGTLSQPS